MLGILNGLMWTESIKRKSTACTLNIIFLMVCSLQMVNCFLNIGLDELWKGSAGGRLELLTSRTISEGRKRVFGDFMLIQGIPGNSTSGSQVEIEEKAHIVVLNTNLKHKQS